MRQATSSEPLAVQLRGHLSAEAAAILDQPQRNLTRWQQTFLLRALNEALNTVARAS
ncbi:MAG TPA: hypothetical protein VGC62_10070 [Pseudomonas sp.]|uniref:hypothetical protein n=1 Tax=Pseudomonas sp. TaxID=306 RepID=UPI002ED7B139